MNLIRVLISQVILRQLDYRRFSKSLKNEHLRRIVKKKRRFFFDFKQVKSDYLLQMFTGFCNFTTSYL